MRNSKFNLSILWLLIFTSCTDDVKTIVEDPPPVKVEDIAAIAAMNNKMAWDLFDRETLAKPQKNILISPFSIQTALSMANNGAGGNTLTEMLKVMYCAGCDVKTINQQHKNLTTYLTKQSGHPTLTVTNGYFYDKSRINLKEEFIKTLQADYSCGFKDENFNNERQSLDNINAWVKMVLARLHCCV